MSLSNLRRNPIDSSISAETIANESHTVAEFTELPGIYGFILTERPIGGTVTVTEDNTAAAVFTIVTTSPLPGQVFIDYNENRGYCIFNSADNGTAVLVDYDGAGANLSVQNVESIATTQTTAAIAAQKDATGGLAGLTLFKINFKNVANTFTSFFTNSNTAARTYTFPDKDGTIACLDDITAADVAGDTHAASSKATPVDADEIPLVDSEASWVLKKLTWANLKATLKTYLDTLYEIKTAYLADVKAVNTAGGTATSGSRFTRTLIEVTDPDSIVSVTASEFTLAAGTYFIKWISPAFAVDSFQTWLRNVTDSTDPIIGSSEFSGATAGSNQCSSSGGDIITIAGTKVFRIEMQVAFTSGTNGLGKPSNYSTSCVYTQVWIQKIP